MTVIQNSYVIERANCLHTFRVIVNRVHTAVRFACVCDSVYYL
jgi:hypothetical protein